VTVSPKTTWLTLSLQKPDKNYIYNMHAMKTLCCCYYYCCAEAHSTQA